MDECIQLQGKNNEGNVYLVSVFTKEGRLTKIEITGKSCKAVQDLLIDYNTLIYKNPKNVINNIKYAMSTHNEYVQKISR